VFIKDTFVQETCFLHLQDGRLRSKSDNYDLHSESNSNIVIFIISVQTYMLIIDPKLLLIYVIPARHLLVVTETKLSFQT